MSRDVTIVLKVDNQFAAPLEEFKEDVAGIAQSTKELDTSTQNVDNSFNNMASSITAGIVAFAGWKGVEAVGQMIDLGKSVNVTALGFGSLTQYIGGSAAVLDQLREATQGATPDVDLMAEATKLLSLNLVDNANDLTHIMSVADDLSDVFGIDAKQGVDAFTKALESGRANSLIRFGIDIDEVKRRTEELKETMDDKSAFRMSVLEQADKELLRFGDTADAAATPIDRLKVSVENLKNTFAQNFSTGVNSTIGIIEIATGNYPGQAEAKEQAAQSARLDAQAFAKEYYDMFSTYIDMAGAQPGITNDFKSQLMFKAMEALKNDPSLDIKKFIGDAIFNAPSSAGVFRFDSDKYVDALVFTMQEADTEAAVKVSNQESALKKVLYAKLLAGDSGREFEAPVDFNAEKYAALLGMPDDRQAGELAQREAQALYDSFHNAMGGINSNMVGAFGTMGYDTSVTDPGLFQQKLDPSYMKSLVPHYMEQSGADQITRDLRSAESELAKLQDMADEHLISDDNLQSAKNMVDNLSAMADQAQNAADNFKNLSLAQALGQGSGGMQGEISDQIISQMQQAGASKEAIDAMQTQLDLASGRETESSQEMKTAIVPIIAKMSANHAAQAMINLDKFLKDAALQGLTDEQIAAAMPGVIAANDGKGGTSKGDSDSYAFMGGYQGKGGGKETGKAPPTENIAKDMANIKKDALNVDLYMANTNTSMTLAAKASTTIHDMFAKIPDKKPVQFIFSSSDPDGIIPVIRAVIGGGSDFSAAMANATRDNGGVPPGTSGDKRGK